MKRLKDLDKRLDCKWRHDIERYVITWEPSWGRPSEIFVVKRKDGGFRSPDMRDIMTLCEGDLHRTDIKERMQKLESYIRDYRQKQNSNINDEIRNSTKDDKIQLKNAYRKDFNTGGKPAEFRRIVPKHKGKTINELGFI